MHNPVVTPVRIQSCLQVLGRTLSNEIPSNEPEDFRWTYKSNSENNAIVEKRNTQNQLYAAEFVVESQGM